MPTVLPVAPRRPKPRPNVGEFKLRGVHVLLILLAFFGTVASVNALMVHYALSTFRGEVSEHPYEEGLAYNSTLSQARAQAARGWKVGGEVTRDAQGVAQIEVHAQDASGTALKGLAMSALLAAPTDKRRDRLVKLQEVGDGLYRGAVETPAGVWDFELSATENDEKLFQSHNRIVLK